jgi:hypothetical protein
VALRAPSWVVSHAWAARLLVVAGVLTGCVALFHAVALVVPSVSEPSPPARHALFIGVNAFFAWAYITRQRWLPIPFGLLFVQQSSSHGTAFFEARAAGHFDLQSALVLASFPVLAVLVVLGRKQGDIGRP